MSFLVSLQGRFSPYVYRVTPTFEATPGTLTAQEGQFAEELQRLQVPVEKPTGRKSASVKAYRHQEKIHQDLHPKVYARDIMSAPLFTVTSEQMLHHASEIMLRMGFRQLPVVDQQGLVGMISEREMLHVENDKKISLMMKPQVIVALESTRIQEIAHVMLDERINALPIVNFKHELAGIITMSDILKYVMNLN